MNGVSEIDTIALRRYVELLKQQATFGAHTPPEIMMEIAELHMKYGSIGNAALSAAAAEPPEPPIKEQIRSIRIAVLSLNQLFVSDRTTAQQWRTQTQHWLVALTVLVLFVAVMLVLR